MALCRTNYSKVNKLGWGGGGGGGETESERGRKKM